MSAETVGLREASERLGLHYMTVYRHVRTGRLTATLDGGVWRVPVAAVDAARGTRVPRGGRPTRRRATARHLELLDRLVAGDEAGAWWLIETSLAGGAEPAAVYLDVLMPALQEVGDRWARGDLSVADEHRASAVALRLIGRLGPRFRRRGRRRGAVVVGAVEGDRHAIPSAVVADLLRAAGFEALDLGANVPVGAFADAATSAHDLRGVAISVSDARCVTALRPTIEALRRAEVAGRVIVGGGGVDRAAALASGATRYTQWATDVVAALHDASAAPGSS